MLTLNDITRIKDALETHTKRRIQLEAEIKLVKKNMKEKYGVESVEEADALIKELEAEREKMQKDLDTRIKNLSTKMESEGLL